MHAHTDDPSTDGRMWIRVSLFGIRLRWFERRLLRRYSTPQVAR